MPNQKQQSYTSRSDEQLVDGEGKTNNNNAGSSRRGQREQRRAYTRQQEGVDWADSRDFSPRPTDRRWKPNARSTEWKSKKEKSKADKKESSEVKPRPNFTAKTEAKADEINYDFGVYEASVPITEMYCQNFEHGHFLNIIDQTYEYLLGLDSRISRSMPLSAFVHCMCNVLNAHILDTATALGRCPIPEREYACDLFGDDLYIPGPLYDYLQNYAKVTTRYGDVVVPNLPPAAVPSAGEHRIVAGTFGAITNENHNLYECYVAPYVTMSRVVASRDGIDNWDPLPPGYSPVGSQPTQNLLGYGYRDFLTHEGLNRLRNATFINDGSLAARLCYSPELFARVQTYLSSKADVFRMVKVPPSASRSGTRIPPKFSIVSTEFTELESGDERSVLRLFNPTILSNQSFAKNQASAVAVFSYHRRRTSRAPGPCYTINGAMIRNWRRYRNDNFYMERDFLPIPGFKAFEPANFERFKSVTSQGFSMQLFQLYVSQFGVKKKAT